MAQAVVTVAIKAFPQGIDITQRNAHLYGSLTIGPAGGTYVTNGLPVDFSAVAFDLRLPIFAGKKAFHVDLLAPSSGFEYEYDPVNFTIRIYAGSQSGSVALVAGAATVTFAVPFAVAPVVTLGPSVTGNTYKVTATTTSLTITSSLGTDTSTVAWIAAPASGIAALLEIPNLAALPAGVTSDTIYFHAVFQRG